MVPAVVDRIVDDNHVVLLVGEEEMERIVPKECLPDDIREGLGLRVSFIGNDLVQVEVVPEATAAAEKRIAVKLDELRQRGRRHR